MRFVHIFLTVRWSFPEPIYLKWLQWNRVVYSFIKYSIRLIKRYKKNDFYSIYFFMYSSRNHTRWPLNFSSAFLNFSSTLNFISASATMGKTMGKTGAVNAPAIMSVANPVKFLLAYMYGTKKGETTVANGETSLEAVMRVVFATVSNFWPNVPLCWFPMAVLEIARNARKIGAKERQKWSASPPSDTHPIG